MREVASQEPPVLRVGIDVGLRTTIIEVDEPCGDHNEPTRYVLPTCIAYTSPKVDQRQVLEVPGLTGAAAIALRFEDSAKANDLWADLALQHDGADRWYLEALGIGSDLHADARFAASGNFSFSSSEPGIASAFTIARYANSS